MTTHNSFHHSLVSEMIEPLALPVSLTGGINQSQLGGLTGFQEALFQSFRQPLGESAPHKAPSGHGVAGVNNFGGLSSRNNFCSEHSLTLPFLE